jgi:signal transduction histidine kinase
MLKRTPSLARRASLIFMSVYASILLAVFALSAVATWADRGEGNLRGPRLALDYAASELREGDGGLQLPKDERFANLAARNPAMWLIVVKDGRSFEAGPVPRAAEPMIAQMQTVVGPVMFRLPGNETPLGAVALQRRELPSGPALMAAGGVDPVTLNAEESMDVILNPGVVLMLGVIAVISLLAMPIAIPSFTRALRPITIEAGAIGPQEPGRRLREGIAPKELLPLVRGFNAALDRLEVELGRRKRFIADVAHELRTPLAVISLRAESPLDEEARQDLRRGVRRLTNLVAQMLDLERLSLSGHQRASVDLVSTAGDVVADLAPLAIERGYDLSLEAPNRPVFVTGDAHAISRAITNLVGNSVAHGGCTGQIRVVVSSDPAIHVMDQGPGVPAALQARLFEPFSRGTLNAEGSGLGLNLVREIMRAQGGEVSLVPGECGATFRLSFASPDGQAEPAPLGLLGEPVTVGEPEI